MRGQLLATTVVLLAAALVATLAAAQTIQLPTVHTFSSDGAVLVPDRGGVLTGGVGRANAGTSTSGGLPTQRGLGSGAAATGTRVTATIHDLQAGPPSPVAAKSSASFAARAVGTPLALPAGDPGLKSVAEWTRERAERVAAEEKAVLAVVEAARTAKAAGRLAASLEQFRSAARRATGPLKQQIETEIKTTEEALFQQKASKAASPVR